MQTQLGVRAGWFEICGVTGTRLCPLIQQVNDHLAELFEIIED